MIQWTNEKVLLMMATTRKNEEIVEDLVCLQEDQLGTHMHPRDIAKELDITHSSACRIIKTKSIKHFKCLKKVHEWYHKGKKSSGCMSLPEKFEKNPQMIECIFFQDEIDFLLQISINKRIVFTLRDRSEMFLIKVVLLKQIDNLLQLLWHGTLWRNYHWSIKRTKLNTENYRNNLKKELYPAMSEIYQQNFYFHPRWNPFTYTRSCLRCFEGRKPYHASYSKKINCPRNHQIAAKWKQMWMKIA